MKTTLVNEKKQGNIKDNEDKQHEEDKDKQHEEDKDEQHEEDKDKQHDGDKEREEGKETAQSVPGEKKTPTKAVKGKYTVHNNGTTKYGWRSDKGMVCFNELYKMVKEARICPQAVAM